MSTTTRAALRLAVLSILLVGVFSMPPESSPSHRISRYSHQNYEHHRSSPTNENPADNKSKVEASRTIAENGRRNHIGRTNSVNSKSINISSNGQRSENGSFKILYGKKPARGTDMSDVVFFPGPKVGDVITAKPCANGQSFCENVEEYPQAYVAGILENSATDFNDILGVDSLDIEVGQRNNFIKTMGMCDSEEKVVFPKQAVNKENKWMLVVNTPDHAQGVRIEVCRSENVSCLFSDRFPVGYVSTCKQKYIYRKLVALSNIGDAYVDLFRLPSCCSCSIQLPGGLDSRFGFANNANESVVVPRKGG